MRLIDSVKIQNFKSIREADLHLRGLNVFIGGNGSGKSNLVGVFHFLNRVAAGELQMYTGVAGGANRILHFGRAHSSSLIVQLMFSDGDNSNGYLAELVPTEQDRFLFSREEVLFHKPKQYPKPYDRLLGSGHSESLLGKASDPISQYARADLGTYRIYHFHDTSSSAGVKQTASVADNKVFHSDGANLASLLFRLKQMDRDRFDLIEHAVRQIAPFFDRFDLEPDRLNSDSIRLEWRERGSETNFTAHALSDGTLRFMCLAVLFLQPTPPPVILIDEPELGLHPAAIAVVADLLQAAATRTQVLAATQSVTLVNQLTPDDVWIVDRGKDERGASTFRHLKAEDMSTWLDDYALGELWEKNILGGRP